jgi:hypothetical protein
VSLAGVSGITAVHPGITTGPAPDRNHRRSLESYIRRKSVRSNQSERSNRGNQQLVHGSPETPQNPTMRPAGELLPLRHRRVFSPVAHVPLWVKSGHSWNFARCPLCPRKQTSAEAMRRPGARATKHRARRGASCSSSSARATS